MYWIQCIDDVAAEVAAAGYQQKYGISDISSLLFSLGLEIPLIWEKNAVNPPWGLGGSRQIFGGFSATSSLIHSNGTYLFKTKGH